MIVVVDYVIAQRDIGSSFDFMQTTSVTLIKLTHVINWDNIICGSVS